MLRCRQCPTEWLSLQGLTRVAKKGHFLEFLTFCSRFMEEPHLYGAYSPPYNLISLDVEGEPMMNTEVNIHRSARQNEGLPSETANPGCEKSTSAESFATFGILSHCWLPMDHHGDDRSSSTNICSHSLMSNDPLNWHRRKMIKVPDDDHIPEFNMDSSSPFHMVRHRARFRALWPLIPS